MPRVRRFDDRWLTLFALTRLLATATAVALLVVRPREEFDTRYTLVALVYGVGTTALAIASPRLRSNRVAWAVDAVVLLGLILSAGAWRSPFYLLAVTALVFPSTNLRFSSAIGVGFAFTAAYTAIAFATGLTPGNIDSTARLETLATHLLVPLQMAFALAYATKLVRRLESERERSEQLAIEAERRRIAWELHDSSKQRVHAAHLLLSQLPDRLEGAQQRAVVQAIEELSRAATDMDSSLWELRAPLETERLEERLRTRARELSDATGARISVRGSAPPLPGWVSTHVYRIASEALTNALRHSATDRVDIDLRSDERELALAVADHGSGLGAGVLRHSTGIESMSARAAAIEGRLAIEKGPNGHGTVVRLRVPVRPRKEQLQ